MKTHILGEGLLLAWMVATALILVSGGAILHVMRGEAEPGRPLAIHDTLARAYEHLNRLTCERLHQSFHQNSSKLNYMMGVVLT